MNIGVIGQGFVGGAITDKFREEFTVHAYDKLWGQVRTFSSSGIKGDMKFQTLYQDEGTNAKFVVENSDYIFVCLPTPMIMDTGECDTSIVENVIKELDSYNEGGERKTVIIKSTVPPGTTTQINVETKNLNVCFSPEFLTEANAKEDFRKQDRIVIGADFDSVPTRRMFKKVFPDADYFSMPSKDAEMVKYTANLFLATKVSFFNDMYDVCQGVGADFDGVMKAVMSDKRIGKSHHMVPGPDGDRGFGGHCFPKDTAAILYLAGMLDIETPTISGAWETNENVRKSRDWEKMDGRAVVKSKRVKSKKD